MSEIKKDKITGVEDTGHEWDGIRELNNPLPKWWLYVLFACILWSFVYWIFMPAWPMLSDYSKGMLGFDRRAVLAEELVAARQKREVMLEKLLATAPEEIVKNPDLVQFSLAGGRTLFGDNCAGCHGSSANGGIGYPNLLDDDWLWDGTLAGIEQTILYGIRSGHEKMRDNQMMAYGESKTGAGDGVLTNEQIELLASWLSGDKEKESLAKPIFAENCVACHGEDGKGNGELGAPNLMDEIWLYGRDKETIQKTISKGRAGVMPTWEARLSKGEIRLLATYIHSLGGGK